ncbi:Uncharacterised protein [Mycobacteroides abscessus]|nr:Uncharacterised protein [Mycobacteroides abscessus]
MTSQRSSVSTGSTAPTATVPSAGSPGTSERTHGASAASCPTAPPGAAASGGVSTCSRFFTSSSTLTTRWWRVHVAPASDVVAVGSKSTVKPRSPARKSSNRAARSDPARYVVPPTVQSSRSSTSSHSRRTPTSAESGTSIFVSRCSGVPARSAR